MGVPNVVYKWKSLRTLYVSVFVMNVAGCLIVVIMIVSAVKLRMGLGQYLNLVVPGDANFWPGMLFLMAFLCAPIYAIGIKLCFHLRFSVSGSIPRLNHVLFIHCLLCFASMIIVLGINTVGILHMLNIQDRNENGILESMQSYATEVLAKVRVDMIQINFRCCGSKSFKDWFHVRWMQREGETLESKDHNDSAVVSTDVPFSCCATEILQPCVHHNIMKPSEVYLYQPEHRLTIATTGCHAQVLSHARYIGSLLILSLILLAAYQMLLALLSRLLQTAHSNAFYIGPRRDNYLAWILGSMPCTEMYNQLVYEGRNVPAEEMVPLCESMTDSRLTIAEKQELDRRCESSVSKSRPLRKTLSKMMTRSNIVNVAGNSAVTILRHKEHDKLLAQMHRDISNSVTNTIPTPPPSPGSEDRIIHANACVSQKGKREMLKKKRSLIKGIAPRVSGSQLKDLRKSLECLKEHQSTWKGGSPILESKKLLVQPSGSRIMSKGFVRNETTAKESPRSASPSSTISSDSKGRNVCVKDSIEEDELRIKKFCKDLSTEYKQSPYSKLRRDFSEQYRRHEASQPGYRETEDNRLARNDICARFNPADTYSRFRGSVQDTMMRRDSQMQQRPQRIIPVSDQKNYTIDPRWRTPAVQHWPRDPQYVESHVLLGQPQPYQQQIFKSQTPHSRQVGGPSWPSQRDPYCPPAPTYFPIPSRPAGPPRLLQCSHGISYRTYQQKPTTFPSRPIRDAEVGSHLRCAGSRTRPTGSGQPPRFSGY